MILNSEMPFASVSNGHHLLYWRHLTKFQIGDFEPRRKRDGSSGTNSNWRPYRCVF